MPQTAPDYRRLFESSPCAYLVLLPDLTICTASDSYLRATMTKREEIAGRPLFEVFPDDPNEAAATGTTNLLASLRRVLVDKRPHRMPVQRYPIRRPESEGGGFEERFWSPLNSPVLDAAGDVSFIIHQVEDVTEVVRLKHDQLAKDRNLQELTALSERYLQLLDAAPDATVIVAGDGIIQLVNTQAEKLFGYAREELIGQSVDLLVPERFRRAHAGHMSRFFAQPDARPMGTGRELFGRRRDGSEIPIEVSLSPQQSAAGFAVSASIRDVSERKRLEAAARVNADRLASAVDAIQDAFALFDADDRLILCNSVYRRLLHETSRGSLIGKPFRELLEAWAEDIEFPDAAAREQFLAERLRQRRTEPTSTFDVSLRDGRRLRVMDRRTAEGGMVKTIWDLTEDEQRAAELRHAQAAAEAANAAKTEFLSSMSHELRTPMNAILGFAQLLQRDKREPLSERQRERVAQIVSGGAHLLRLIDDILDLSRIESGKVSMSIEPVDVLPVLNDVMTTLQPMAARFGIAMELLPGADHLPPIAADRTRFAQVLMNFGSNAIKYNRPGGKVFFACAAPQAGRVRVSVRDTGIGIAKENQEKLFQPFQRAGQETGPIEGTGIGLVICQRLARFMQGDVGFESRPDEGSEFWIDIPVHAPRPEAGERTRPLISASERPLSDAQRLVLYVEDNPANVVFMRDLMGEFEHIELLTAPTGEIAIEVARARKPHAIIMDINLPHMSGADALRKLRALPETREIPVIALTAAASERDIQHGLRAGFFRYLTKPVNVDELIGALELLLTCGTSAASAD